MSAPRPPPLLGPDDPPAVHMVEATGPAPVLLICDHAAAAVPAALGRLGLPEAAFALHIAWDIGAAALTRLLAARLGAAAVLAGYSRLVMDLNRQPGHPTSIPPVSDGIAIPANQDLDDGEAERREEALFEPYHHAITTQLARLWRHGPAQAQAPALIAIHSFTPVLDGFARPWQVGVLWNRDPRLAVPLMRALAGQGLVVGDNLPYSGRDIGYTIDTHAGAAGLPHVSLEIRQDLLADQAGLDQWADRLDRALAPVLAMPGLHRAEIY